MAQLAALLTGLGAVAVYRTTLLPGLGAWDTAEAQAVLPLMGTLHPTGFPAYTLLGWLASVVLQPLGSPAFVVNFLSALLAGFAVATTVFVMHRLAVPIAIAVACAAGLALTPIVWSIASAADAHALHLALVAAVTLGLLRWGSLVARRRAHPEDPGLARRADRAIVLTAGVFGIAVANHALALLLIPAIGLYVLAVDAPILLRPKAVLAAIAACLGVAALLYLELPLRSGIFRAPLVYGHPETWNGFWDTVLARQFQGDVRGLFADLPRKAGELGNLAFAQLGPLVAVVPAGLLVTAVRHPRYALLSGVATGVTCLFAASYSNAAIDRYYLGPAFFAWTWTAVLAGALADRIALRGDASDDEPEDDGAVIALPGSRWGPAAVVVAVALGIALLVPTAASLGERWKVVDRSGQAWVDSWLDELFGSLEPNAVVISWWSYSTPMWYAQLVEGRRPDVWVVDDRVRGDEHLGEVPDVIDAWLGTRPVYLIRPRDADVGSLMDRYTIERADQPGNLYRVTGRQETQP